VASNVTRLPVRQPGGPSTKFAGGKPLNLIDGSGLLALCQECDIPARILDQSKRKRTVSGRG
jgi:hypothetical protein